MAGRIYFKTLAPARKISQISTNRLLSPPASCVSLNLPPTLLLGPGPSNCPPRVLQAMAMNTQGHLHKPFLETMDDISEMLKYAFQTKNENTLAITGSGAACMEACVSNFLRPGDKFIIGCNGYWGYRMTDVATRQGIEVIQLKKEWGMPISLEEVETALNQHSNAKALFLTHAESSTGMLQPLEGFGDLCRKSGRDCLLMVDAVVSLGGVPVFTDDWKIDVIYSGGQKNLSSAPGLSPYSFNTRAKERINSLNTCPSFYLDLSLLSRYWDCAKSGTRIYHHTGSIHSPYALREALRILLEEGLEKSWQRHEKNAKSLWEGLYALNLFPFIENPSYRAAPLTTVVVPQTVVANDVQQYLFQTYNIEIAGGLGDLAGKIWRIGLMGNNSRSVNVLAVIGALADAISRHHKEKW